MNVFAKAMIRIALILLFSSSFLYGYSNVNAIDFSKISYPKSLQNEVDFLRNNDGIYNHWVHNWTASVSKEKVTEKLTLLYRELEKLPAKNVEAELLLGDIAHYLYNMEEDAYYQKAVDHYRAAQTISQEDYRVYWFLGNHYALSDQQVLSIQTYKVAFKYLPRPTPHELFWADYAVACANANMQSTARYAAHQSSKLAGAESYIEKEILPVTTNALHAPPPDTTIKSSDMWITCGREGKELLINNYLLGIRVAFDTTWKSSAGDYKDYKAYVTFKPNAVTAKKNGKKINYSILVLTQAVSNNLTLEQFLEKFIAGYKNRKPVKFNIGNISDCMAYEIIEPSMYTDIGGGHMYAIAIERNLPAYPGMAIEEPQDLPKSGKGSGMTYYRSNRSFGRLSNKLYYLILLDSCEYIHEESLAVFEDFLENRLVIE
jgi:hypothetical protein